MKVGDKVQCICDIMVEDKFKVGETYVLSDVSPDGEHGSFKHTGDSLWHLDRFVNIKKKDMQMKFNPKPGDKIICNNGEEFTCCTLEFLRDTITGQIQSSLPILGYYKTENDESWQDWNEDGTTRFNDFEYKIREVIPAESKEVVKEEETRYSVSEIQTMFTALVASIEARDEEWTIAEIFDIIKKRKYAEYQEYLRLRAIYE